MPTKEEIEREGANVKEFMEHVRRVKGQVQQKTVEVAVEQIIVQREETAQVPLTTAIVDHPAIQLTALPVEQTPVSLVSDSVDDNEQIALLSTITLEEDTEPVVVQHAKSEPVTLATEVAVYYGERLASSVLGDSIGYKEQTTSLSIKTLKEGVRSVVIQRAKNMPVSLVTEEHSIEQPAPPSIEKVLVPLISGKDLSDNEQTALSPTTTLEEDAELVVVHGDKSMQVTPATEIAVYPGERLESSVPIGDSHNKKTGLTVIWSWLPYVIVPAAVLVVTCMFYRYKVTQLQAAPPDDLGAADAAVAQAAVQVAQQFLPGPPQEAPPGVPGSQVINADVLVAGAVAAAAVQLPEAHEEEPEPELGGGMVAGMVAPHGGLAAEAGAVIPRGLVLALAGARTAHKRDISMGKESDDIRDRHKPFLEELGRRGAHVVGPRSHIDDGDAQAAVGAAEVADEIEPGEGVPPADAAESPVEERELAGDHPDSDNEG